jgi:hypothetical protein
MDQGTPAPSSKDDDEMKRIVLIVAACIALGSIAHAKDQAFYVPAHRTKDGSYAPPNVPPNSAAATAARGPAAAHLSRADRHRTKHRHRPKYVPPLFVHAPPMGAEWTALPPDQ